MIKLPSEQGWKQLNISDKLGSIWSSWNLDLRSNLGKVRVSPRTIVNTDDITDLGVPVAFQVFTDVNGGVQYFWAVAGSFIFRATTSDAYVTAFVKDSSTGANTDYDSDYSDLLRYGNSHMFATRGNDISLYTASTGQWTEYTGSPLAGNVAHMLCRYGNRMYVLDKDSSLRVRVSSLTTALNDLTSANASYDLNLSNKGWEVTRATCIKATTNRIWVGTLNQSGEGCWIFAWDGVQASDPNEAYYIPEANGILAMVIKDDVPWVIDNNGTIRYFSAGSFVVAPFGKLPVKDTKFLKNSLSSSNNRWIHPNGLVLFEGKIRALINGEYADNGATQEENIASGVWEYDSEVGWYHVQSISYHPASAGSVTDYGQNRVSRVGALFYAKDDSTTSSANGTMLAGAQLYSDASSTKEVIVTDDSNDTIQKFGYLVTTKIYSNQVQDTWVKVYLRLKKLLNSANRVWVRYRTSDVAPTEATITWTSTTTFTTTTNVSAYAGYEVEVLQGKGAGRCEKITSVSESGGTYTVTVASAFTGASSGTAKARFQYWKEAGNVFSSQTDQVGHFPVGDFVTSPWIQLKICMQFLGEDEIDDIIIINKTSQEAN
jgi:hypothetical protein